jgi:hypothetical protein
MNFVEAGTRIGGEYDKIAIIKGNCASVLGDAVRDRASSGDITRNLQKDLKKTLENFNNDDKVDILCAVVQILATDIAKYAPSSSSSSGYDDDFDYDDNSRRRKRSGNIFRR